MPKADIVRARLIADANISFDPLVTLSGDKLVIVGIHCRFSNDWFPFKLFPKENNRTIFQTISESDKSSLFGNISIPFSVDGFQYFSISKSRLGTQYLVYPTLTADNSSRFLWKISTSKPTKTPVLQISNITRNFWYMPNDVSKEIEQYDFSAHPVIERDISIGSGFMLVVIGQGYAHRLLFRLIGANVPRPTFCIKCEAQSLDISLKSQTPIEATLCVTPVADKSKKFILGVPTIASGFDGAIFAVGEPLPPRYLRAVASAATGMRSVPISRFPKLGNPKPVPPITTFTSAEAVVLPVVGRRHSSYFHNNVKKLIFFGRVNSAIWIAWEKIKKLDFVGLVTDSWLDATLLVGSDAKSVRHGKSELLIKRDANYLVAALLVRSLTESWRDIEEFVVLDQNTSFYPWNKHRSVPPGFVVDMTTHFAGRLPAIPACIDLEIGAIVQLINTQRGRITPDNGSDILNYEDLFASRYWIAKGGLVDLQSRDDIKFALSIRGAVEYMAARAFVDFSAFRDGGKAKSSRARDYDKNYCVRSVVELFLDGVNRNKEKFRQACKDLAVHYSSSEVRGGRELDDIAIEMLRNVYARRDAARLCRQAGVWLNPLCIVLAGGPDRSSNTSELELGLLNWVSFAGGLAANKPSAIMVTMHPREELTPALRRQFRLSRLIRTFADNPSGSERILIMRTRAALAATISDLLGLSTLEVLTCLGADRVVYHSSLNLDFIPIYGTILAMEYPLVRYPAQELIIDGFVLPVVARITENLTINSGAICVAMTANDAVVAAWSQRMYEAISTAAPLIGVSSENITTPESALELEEAVTVSNLVFFLGHATSELGGHFVLKSEEISFFNIKQYDWEGKIVFLIGCETATQNEDNPDLAAQLLRAGAQVVFGATASISVQVAKLFLDGLFEYSVAGTPLDYAFFRAKREAVIFEVLVAIGTDERAAETISRSAVQTADPDRSFLDILINLGITWNQAYINAVYSLSITMTGGAGLRLN